MGLLRRRRLAVPAPARCLRARRRAGRHRRLRRQHHADRADVPHGGQPARRGAAVGAGRAAGGGAGRAPTPALAATFVLLVVWTWMGARRSAEPRTGRSCRCGPPRPRAAAWLRWRPGLHLAALSLIAWLVPLGFFVLDRHAHWLVVLLGWRWRPRPWPPAAGHRSAPPASAQPLFAYAIVDRLCRPLHHAVHRRCAGARHASAASIAAPAAAGGADAGAAARPPCCGRSPPTTAAALWLAYARLRARDVLALRDDARHAAQHLAVFLVAAAASSAHSPGPPSACTSARPPAEVAGMKTVPQDAPLALRHRGPGADRCARPCMVVDRVLLLQDGPRDHAADRAGRSARLVPRRVRAARLRHRPRAACGCSTARCRERNAPFYVMLEKKGRRLAAGQGDARACRRRRRPTASC